MRVITAPAIEPITLTEVKAQLGITDTLMDTIITRRIIEARQWAEDYMQRAIITQTQEIRLDSFPTEKITLPFPNFLSIVSIKYIDQDGVETTLAASAYEVDTYSYKGSVRPIYGTSWPSARAEGNAVRVQYTCGYGATTASVPDLIREALIMLVGHWVNNQPQSESGTTIARVPYAVRDIFDKYMVHRSA